MCELRGRCAWIAPQVVEMPPLFSCPYRIAFFLMFTVKALSAPCGTVRYWFYKEPQCSSFDYQEASGADSGLDSALSCQTGNIGNAAGEECDRVRSGFGSQGRKTVFSRLARRALISAGAALERRFPKDEILFCTFTYPGSTREGYRAIAEWSGYVVHRLKAWVAKRCPSKLDFYCWEWQKRGALHLHYVIHVPDPAAMKALEHGLKDEWIRLIDSVCLKSGVDLWKKSDGSSWSGYKSVVRVAVERVKKSVARYLAKYLSKAESKGGEGYSDEYYPSRWYGISRALRDMVEDMSRSYEMSGIRTVRDAILICQKVSEKLDMITDKLRKWRCGTTNNESYVALTKIEDEGWIRQCLETLIGSSMKSIKTRLQQKQDLVLEMMRKIKENKYWQREYSDCVSQYVTSLMSNSFDVTSISEMDLDLIADTFAFSLKQSMRVSGFADLVSLNMLRKMDTLIPGVQYCPSFKKPSQPAAIQNVDAVAVSEDCLIESTPLSKVINDRVEQMSLLDWAVM